MSNYASESGHWYHRDGSPAYTIIGKNGQERPTTLRDARKEKLVPSVTTIIKCASTPGLTSWIIDQHILAALTLPRISGETDIDFIARVKIDAKEQAKKAAEMGTQIHAWIEQGFNGDVPPEGVPYFKSALAAIEAECGDVYWCSEKSFATPRYGGKVDLHTPETLIDIKTTEKPLDGLKTWDEHSMQLAAYDVGLGNPGRMCGILYVNSIDASSRMIWIDNDEISRGLKCFNALVDFWYAKNRI